MAGLLELAIYHTQERSLFHRLVCDLGQEKESMRWVIALWLWFESVGHDKFMHRASALPGPVVVRFVDEALACLARLAGRQLAGASTFLPCTNALLNEPIDDVTYFDKHRDTIMGGVRALYKNVCRVVLDDVCASDDAVFLPKTSTASVPRAIGTSAGLAAFAGPAPAAPQTASQSQLNAMAEPWSPIRVPPEQQQIFNLLPDQIIDPLAEQIINNPLPEQIINPLPEEYRSLFITFSRGYPIDKDDIAEFFNSLHGPCVETVMVERAAPGQLPVYGRVVLHDPEMISVLLGGEPTAKYLIKGRHLWARVYVPSSKSSSFQA